MNWKVLTHSTVWHDDCISKGVVGVRFGNICIATKDKRLVLKLLYLGGMQGLFGPYQDMFSDTERCALFGLPMVIKGSI